MFRGFGLSTSFKSQPDVFQLELGFKHDDALSPRPGPKEASRFLEAPAVEWQSGEADEEVLDRVRAALAHPGLVEERVHVRLRERGAAGIVAARLFDVHSVAVLLEVERRSPALRSVALTRTAGGGSMRPALALAVWALLEAEGVTRVRCNDGGGLPWDAGLLARLQGLRVLNLSHCGLATLPGAVGALAGLQELRLVGNRLKVLPPELGQLRRLRTLAADSNEISILPGELRNCQMLEELTLENNRLTSVLLSFSAFPHLQVLHLYNNPLEFLPEFSPCQELRHLSVANLRVTANAGYSKFKVELLQPPSGSGYSLFDTKQTDKLRPIFSLMLRRSSGHHPLLAGALRCLVEEDTKNRDLMARQENALQQLILMALNDNSIVVEQTCATLLLLAQHSQALADSLVANDIISITSLLNVPEEKVQLSCLQVLASIALTSEDASEKLLTHRLLTLLLGLLSAGDGSAQLRAAALEALGNFAFSAKNKLRFLQQHDLMATIFSLANLPADSSSLQTRSAAVRLLAILGENEHVLQAVGRHPLGDRGLRVLAMDGGGMKGICTVRLLRELEERTGRPIHELFDLIVGTSTGGLLAVAAGLRQLSLDECDHIYKVFSRPLASKDKEESWVESFYRTFQTRTQHVRAVVVGCKHDSAVYEALLKDYCEFGNQPGCIGSAMIDTACLDVPKVALVSTLASMTPAVPFVFRNYELAPDKEPLFQQIFAHMGSSKHPVWQAVRASSAATYYLDDFTCGNDKFQDGAVTANNPAVIALQEARLLWPDRPIEVFVSVGSGSTPPVRRDKAMSSFMETGSILIESATSVQRTAETMATLLPLVPSMRYFRFAPMDPRCAMELDEIDPKEWEKLEAATDEYIDSAATEFAAAAEALLASRQNEAPGTRSPRKLWPSALRRLAVIRAPGPSGTDTAPASDAIAAACAQRPECVAVVDLAPATVGAPPSKEPAKQLSSLAAATTQGTEPAPGPPNAVHADGSPSGADNQGFASYFSWFSPSKAGPAGQPADEQGSPAPAAAALAEEVPPPEAPAEQPSPPGTVPRAAEAEDPLAYCLEQLARIPASVGMLHLALQAHAEGLVLAWQQHYRGILEPSVEAAELVAQLGHNPAKQSLSQLFDGTAAVARGSRQVQVVSMQTQWLNAKRVSQLLLQISEPAVVIASGQIAVLADHLRGRVLVTPTALSADMLQALLAQGAEAVVCPRRGGEPAAPEQLAASLFELLYSALVQGGDLVSCLRRAEDQQPSLRGALAVHCLREGVLAALPVYSS